MGQRTLANGGDAVSVLVGDLDGKLLCMAWKELSQHSGSKWLSRGRRLTLDGHDHLDGVERVEAEVVGERRGGRDLM